MDIRCIRKDASEKMIPPLQNQSISERSVRVVMSTTSVFYTGQRAKLVKRGEGEFALRPNESESSHNSSNCIIVF